MFEYRKAAAPALFVRIAIFRVEEVFVLSSSSVPLPEGRKVTVTNVSRSEVAFPTHVKTSFHGLPGDLKIRSREVLCSRALTGNFRSTSVSGNYWCADKA
jgi:hypothetical protein